MQNISSAALQELLRGGRVPYTLLISPADGDPITIDSSDDILSGSLMIDRRSSDTESLQIGNTTAASLQCTILNIDGKFDNVTFDGATVQPTFNLAGGSIVPGGVFVIDERPARGAHMQLKALDKMMRFNRPYSGGVNKDQTLASAINVVCLACSVPVTATIPNGSYVLKEGIPKDEGLTWRQVLEWLLQLMPANAYIDPVGMMQFAWYDSNAQAFPVPASATWESAIAENEIEITGVIYAREDGAEVIAGTDDYALTITWNPLIEADEDNCLSRISGSVVGLKAHPLKLETLGFPHLWPMDKLQVSANGKTHNTYATRVSFSTESGSILETRSVSKAMRGYATAAPLTKAQRIAVQNYVKAAQATSLSSTATSIAQLNEALAVALGYYSTVVETPQQGGSVLTITYLHDAPILEESQTIFLQGGVDKFAWTNSGWNDGNPAWEYGMTPGGNVIMQSIAAHKITADLIRLSSDTDSMLDEVLASIDESIDVVSDTLGRIDTEQRITALDRLALQAEYDRVRTESSHLALILADVDDSMFGDYEGSISEYDTAATAVLGWLAYATDAPNFSDVDTSEWGDLQADYLLAIDRVNQLAQVVETHHRAELTSQMLEFEQVQGQFQERLKIDAQGMTINVDDENALTIRKDGMRIYVDGVERAEFTSDGFAAEQGRVDVLQVGAHIVSRDGDITVWRPI